MLKIWARLGLDRILILNDKLLKIYVYLHNTEILEMLVIIYIAFVLNVQLNKVHLQKW